MEEHGDFTIAWHIPRLYGWASRVVETQLQDGLAAAGFGDLRPAHLRVFEHLPRHGARLTDIARRAQATKQAIGYLVAELERRGYLERVPDASDGRASIIRRTDRGRAADEVVFTILAREDQEWRRRLGSKRYDDILAALRDLSAVVVARREELGA
ncbi:MAG TPA: MarR family transcriptional regulator [Thermomicrobiales bacterium]|nr:MarR family transcriptional regulator [Thermomicrobiales bacterium]